MVCSPFGKLLLNGCAALRQSCAVIAVVFLCAGAVIGGTIRHDVSDQQYRDLAAQPQFGTVGKFIVYGASGGFLSSGVVIDPWWVLTAAHVVDDATKVSFAINGQTFAGDTWSVHPDWDANSISFGYDLAIVKLGVPTGLSPSGLYAGSSELGMTGVSVGYGRTGTGLTGDVSSSGTKRAGENVLDVITPQGELDQRRILLTDFDNPDSSLENRYGSATPADLEYMIAPGDSGGPMFIDDGTGYKIAGISSYVSCIDGDLDSDYGDSAGYTRVSRFVSWVEDAISSTTAPTPGDANLDGAVDLEDFNLLKNAFGVPGFWTGGDFDGDGLVGLADFVLLKANFGAGGTVPEPTGLSLLLVGAASLSRRRRRR